MSYIGNEPIVSATRTVTEITATAGQTTFTANGGYTVGYIDVFVNGAQLQTSDFTATNGSTITLSSPAVIGDDIRLVAWGTFNTSSVQGNLAFTGTGNRITGDFSNGTIANRVMFQTSTINGATQVRAIPNGTQTVASVQAGNGSDPNNQSVIAINATPTECSLSSQINGTGTFLPLTMLTGGSERLRIDTSGNVGIGTSSPTSFGAGAVMLTVAGSSGYGGYLASTTSVTGQLWANQADPSVYVGSRTNHPLVVTTNNTERLRVDTSGNIGIGTSSPAQKLDVAGNITGNDYIIRATAGTIGYTGANGAGIEIYGSSSGTPNIVTVRTSNAERMRITSAGVVELTSGQLKFPASQNASADANTLDDYEEGTWTATFFTGSNGTGTNLGSSGVAGTYVKIGRVVTLNFYRTNTGAAALSITGMPFAPSGDRLSGLTADGLALFNNGDTILNYRGSGEGQYSRGTVTYITS